MAELTKSDIRHISKLAGLKLNKAEIERFAKQLSEVIAYVKQLDEVDTSSIEPTNQTTGLENKTRQDKVNVAHSLSQKAVVSGTDKVHNGYFVVPMVLEERSDY